MSEEMIQILTECIAAIEEGRLTVDECLAKYGEYRDELEPLLMVVAEMSALPAVLPSLEFREAAAMRLMEKIHMDLQCSLPPLPYSAVEISC